MNRNLSFTIALICLGLLLGACSLKKEVSEKQTQQFTNQLLRLTSAQNNLLIGKSYYAGHDAKDLNFKSAQRVLLTDIKLRSMKCQYHNPTGTNLLTKDIWCHLYGVFSFQDTKGLTKEYKTLIKIRANQNGILAEKELLKNHLLRAFGTVNPFRLSHYKPFFNLLQKRKLAIGMPTEYLRLIWGHPERVVNLTIDKNGKSETFVYPRYFVLLLNGVVESIHKFDDLDMKTELVSQL